MAREKANPTEKELMPICSAIVALNVDRQYTEPIEQCNNKAGIAARIHLFSNIITPYYSLVTLIIYARQKYVFLSPSHFPVEVYILKRHRDVAFVFYY